MATLDLPNRDLAISADAVGLLSTVSEGLDSLLLQAASRVASRRSSDTVTVDDIREALQVLCDALERTAQDQGLSEPARLALHQVVEYLKQLSLKC